MLKRIVSAIIGLPFLLAIIFIGGMPLFIAILIVSLIGLREFYNACKNKSLFPVEVIGYLGSIALIVLVNFSYSPSYIFLLFFILIFLLNSIQLIYGKYNFLDISVTLYGLAYVPLLLSCILLISKQPNNIVIWLVFTTAWGTDTFAYFSGYFFGKRKLCPSISPKKTVAGAIGGVLGSISISVLFGYFFLQDYIIVVAFIGAIGSIVAQVGDLSASLIKRHTGIKDFGNLIPGHGGVLDRFDSILFTAPTIYFILNFVINRR
ncbi:phosphatidate cytidylyltransferase [Alkaliphilus sp. MSJ-5]|uniref:Phosphatidate cytidylyltransferase n=1 Tax=Alkaliphilus flagellatus TaxID=2841507 RepID=A0ABS6G4N8_9FIRM|nr:phosphatidate cytidylyltransferase [Alkaliphilus flagellatus]MBU5677451.1 phosphatidate cytidylyltransferase [Alkaliphilus flagellatus]